MSEAAVVTGAARGLGRAIATRLATDGGRVILVDVDPSVQDAAAEIAGEGAQATAVVADITEPAGRDAVRAAVADGPLHALVNNAGILRDNRIVKMQEADFLVLAEGSAIVNIASRAYLGNFGQFNYSASKGGLVGMTRALALELAPRTRVNAIAPSLTASEMTKSMPPDVLDKLIAAIPMGRMAQPEEVAELVAATASSYVTGQVLIACGGRSLAP